MTQADEPFLEKPKTVDEFMRCLNCHGWDPSVIFDEGSKMCLNLKPQLIREALKALQNRTDLPRYLLALSKIVHLSADDDRLKIEWRNNLRQLRALMYTSAIGTARQRAKLIEIAGNEVVVAAMRNALQQEIDVVERQIEPTWIAVLYAEGSEASVSEADRFNVLLDTKLQVALLSYKNKPASINTIE